MGRHRRTPSLFGRHALTPRSVRAQEAPTAGRSPPGQAAAIPCKAASTSRSPQSVPQPWPTRRRQSVTVDQARAGVFRSESIFRCSRIPKRWRSGSTSAGPQAPTAREAVAAAPTAAGAPRVPNRPDQTGLPDVASRGSDSSPSQRRCSSPGPMDHPGTSDSRAQGPEPPGPRGWGRRPVRKRTKPTRHPSARSWTAEPTVSFALRSPSPKNFH